MRSGMRFCERVVIVGIGSPVSGDGAGLLAVELLQKRLQWSDPTVEFLWQMYERPGLSLLEVWQTTDCVVLIDALLSEAGTPPVQRLELGQLLAEASPLSSHSVGVAETLALAQTLDALPAQLIIFGIHSAVTANREAWLAPLSEMLSESLGGRLSFRPPDE